MYGDGVTHEQILHGHTVVPAAAHGLLWELDQYPPKVQTSQAN